MIESYEPFGGSQNSQISRRPKRKRKAKIKQTNSELHSKPQMKVKNFSQDLQKYDAVYFFMYPDIRKETVRREVFPEWTDSEIYIDRKKLGRRFKDLIPPADWLKLSMAMRGQIGLLLTNRPHRLVVDWFDKFSVWDYPHIGFHVDITITLNKGPLMQFEKEIEPHLRSLGMPTAIQNGVVILTEDFEVCKAGTQLKEEQIYFLKLLGEKLSVYQLKLKARWTKNSGFKFLSEYEEEFENGDFEEEDEVYYSESD